MPLGMTEHELLAKLRFDIAGDSFESMRKRIDTLKTKLNETEVAAKKTREQLSKMREDAEKLQQVGTTLAVAGAAIMAPMLLASRAYIQAVGEGEATSKRFITAQERLKDAQIRIGRETTEVLTPLLEKGADLAEKFASLIEKNPDLLKGILAVGGGLAAAGTLTTLIAQVQRLIATVGLLTGGKGIGGSILTFASSNPLTTAMTIAGAPIAAAGYGINKLGDKLGLGDATSLLSLLSSFSPIFAGVAGMRGIMQGFDALKNGPETYGSKETKFSGRTPMETVTNQQMQAYLNYQSSVTQLDTQYQRRRLDLVRNFNQQQKQELEDFNRTRQRAMRDFYENERQAEREYYRNRMQAARQHNVETQRAEEDHQRDMQRMREDFDAQAEDLIAGRDALGLVRATRDYERERRRAEEDYRVEASRRNQDFARQMADMAEQFAISRQQRLADFQQRLKDEKEDFEIRRRRAEQEHRQQLQDLQQQYYDERRKRYEAFRQQLEDLADVLTKERILRDKFTEAMLDDLRRAIKSVTGKTTGFDTTPGVGTRDSGGYMWPGLYRNASGRREFVLSPDSTEMAEKLMGRQLNQERILALMSRGGSTGTASQSGVVYNDYRRIDSRLSSEDRRKVQQDTTETLREMIGR